MADLNNDGKIDKFEQKQFHLFGGRSFFLSILVIVILTVLGFLNKGEAAYYPLCVALGIYLGRSSAEDFSKIKGTR